MLLFIVFAPLITALLILIGAPARLTALLGSGATVIAALAAFFLYDPARAGFQFVSSFPISEAWRLQFLLGADGLSLVMLFLAALVLLCAVWFTPPIEKSEPLFYACLLFLASGAIGAFASLDLFFFYAFHELALDSDFSSHRHLGLGQPLRGGLESDYLSRARQLRFAPRADPALSQRAARPAQF